MKNKNLLIISLFLLSLFLNNVLGTTTISAPAVYYIDENGTESLSGDTILIDITAKNGTGKILVNIGNSNIDDVMQCSIKTSKYVAFKITNKNPKKYDLIYNIHTDAPKIEGPSAGGLFTVATICELNNWSINHSVIMTGTINPDGSIGKVGGVIEKIEAASKTKNITLFLIPKGERFVDNISMEYNNINNGNNNSSKNNNTTIDVVKYGKKLGIKVVEVSSIFDVIPYFTNKKIELKEYKKNKLIEQKYKNISKKLYNNVINNTINKYNTIEKKLQKINKTENNLINNTIIKTLYNKLNNSKNAINEGKQYYNNKSYYTGVSKLFGALIELEQINTSINYYSAQNQTEKKRYVKNYLNNTEKLINNYKKIVNNQKITENNFEYIFASKSRIYEGDETLKEAYNQYNNGNLIEALNMGVYAKLRAISGIWWLSLSNNYNYENLDNTVIYNNLLNNKNSNSNNYINSAELSIISRKYLDKAQKYYLIGYSNLPELTIYKIQKDLVLSKEYYNNEQYLLSISKSINIIVSCELYFNYLSDINYIKNTTTNKINKVEQLNYTPIQALCYREYSENLNDRISKIYYLKHSYYYAQLSEDILDAVLYNQPITIVNLDYSTYNNIVNNNNNKNNGNNGNNIFNLNKSPKLYRSYIMVIVWSIILLIAGAYFGILIIKM